MELKRFGLPKPPILCRLQTSSCLPTGIVGEDFFIADGILVKSAPRTKNLPDHAVVVSEKLVRQVITGLHCSTFGGHLGISKIISKAMGRFFWPQMGRCIRKFVQSCRVCGEIKASTSTSKALMRPINVSEPFVFWAMD